MLTIDNRIRELERKSQIQADTIKILHNLIKEIRKEMTEFLLNGLRKPKI